MRKGLTRGRFDDRYVLLPLTIFAVLLTAWAFTGEWPFRAHAYNSFSLQADAWLHGRLDLGQDYPWLELAIYEGKYFVSFPPFPSMLLLPFVAIWGTGFPDSLLLQAVTCIGVVYAIRLYKKVAPNQHMLTYTVLFLYLANGYLFIGLTGWVWFFAQSVCFTLCLMALTYAVMGRGGLSLTCLACAVGCRPMVMIYLPLLLLILWNKCGEERSVRGVFRLIRKKWYWVIAPLIVGGSYMVLNYLRFGSVFEFGHSYLPEFTRSAEGQFSLSYFWNNFVKLFAMPQYNGDSAAMTFSKYEGSAFWLTNPMFVWALIVWVVDLVKREGVDRVQHTVFPLLVLAHLFFICCHRTLGGWQFGNRYLVDFLPFLYFGMIRSRVWDRRLCRWSMPTFALAVSLNLVGTVALYCHWL